MAQSATFGFPGYDQQTYLPGTTTALLPEATNLSAPLPDALSSEPFTPTADGTTSLLNGGVAATTTGFGTAGQHTTYDVTGAWNSVKNASVVMDGAGSVTFAGFVHADAMVGAGADQATTVELLGVKRGNVVTGSGADQVQIQVASNGENWSNEFRVQSGAGNDVVSVSVLDTTDAAKLDPTFASALATALDYGYDGAKTRLHMDLGAGDDAAKGLGADDVIEGGLGSSFLSGGGGNDRFFIDARNGEVTWSTITDWQAGDQLGIRGWQPGVSTMTWLESAGATGYEGATMHADVNGDGTIDTSVTWTGLSSAQIPAATVMQAEGMLWFA